MNVLHLTTHVDMGGITQYILRLMPQLRKRGMKVYVASAGGRLESDLQDAGAETLTLNIRTKSELDPKIYFTIPRLIRFIRENHIDIIHAHTRVTQVLAFWVGKFSRTPVVSTCHGFYKRRLGRRLLPAWGDKVIAISDGVQDFLKSEFQVPENKISLVFNAVDIESLDRKLKEKNRAEMLTQFGIPHDAYVIGIIARLVQDKGHHHLIEALSLLKPKYPQMHVLIVGEGRERVKLETLAKNLNLESDVTFAGNQDDISGPLSVMNLFALPATWREGFGLSIIEAMTARIPIIVTNIWALNTLVQSERTGILIPAKDSQALASAIERVFVTPKFASNLKREGRLMVERLFGIDHFADLITQTYRTSFRPRR